MPSNTDHCRMVLPTRKIRVAIVGAGITGAVAAGELISAFVNKSPKNDDNNKQSSTSPSSANDRFQQIKVVVFDQGRRGPGGRASHRSVRISTGEVLPDDDKDILKYNTRNNDNDVGEGTYQFDHGCQFSRADSSLMRNELLDSWLAKGWVHPWEARLGSLSSENDNEGSSTITTTQTDFFGIPSRLPNDHEISRNTDLYIGVGGMHLLPRRILDEYNNSNNHEDSTANQNGVLDVHRGTRVQCVKRNTESGKWDVYTINGNAAYHDTTDKKNQTSNSELITHDDFDAVIFTDISSSFDSWHRASAGIPDTFRSKLPSKIRIPLFSCMIALSHPIRKYLPYDAFTTTGGNKHNKLWFAASSDSKPGMTNSHHLLHDSGGSDNEFNCSITSSSPAECWTLISTPSFAVQEIQSTTMRDEKTGEFRPQENSYLNSIPGPALAEEFLEIVRPYILSSLSSSQQLQSPNDHAIMPKIVYLQAQRWGSGLPAPESIVKSTVDVCGTTYVSEFVETSSSSLVFDRPTLDLATYGGGDDSDDRDFIADDSLGLYYAGDFCSHRNPGFEAAALSGLDVAKHLSSILRDQK